MSIVATFSNPKSKYKIMQNIFWTGYSDKDRHAAISQIQAIVAQFGDLVDIRLFSDISPFHMQLET